jgi:hypothetical protein
MKKKFNSLNIIKIITLQTFLCIHLFTTYSFGQINDYYDKFNTSNSQWNFILNYDSDTITLGNYITKDNIKFHGAISKNNKSRFGWIRAETYFDTLVYCGLFNKTNFIGFRYSQRFDNIYKGSWSKNMITLKYDSSTLDFSRTLKEKTGKYIIFYKNDAFYYGDIVKGQRQGNGVYISKSGYVYLGEWYKNKRIGNSNSVIFKNGKGFRGRWKNNDIEGFGILYSQREIIKSNLWEEKRQKLFNDENLIIEKNSFSERLETKSIYYLDYNIKIKDDLSIPETIVNENNISSVAPSIQSNENELTKTEDELTKLEKEKVWIKNFMKKHDSIYKKSKYYVKDNNNYQNNNKTAKVENRKKNDSWFDSFLHGVWTIVQWILKILVILFLLFIVIAFISPSSRKEERIKPINPIVIKEKQIKSKSNPKTEKEKEITDFFEKKFPNKPSIFWVGDKHRTHPWSKQPGGCTVVTILKKEYSKSNRCLGYDKIKRPYEYTSKIIVPYISNHTSNKRIYNLGKYIENIYIAKENSNRIYEVWSSNMNGSLEEILMKYRTK